MKLGLGIFQKISFEIQYGCPLNLEKRIYLSKGYGQKLLIKKSKQGIATPKPDMEVIRERLKAAEMHAKGEK